MDRKNIVRFLLIIIIIDVIMFVIPKSIGFGKAGFAQEFILKQFNYYMIAGIISTVILFFIFWFMYFVKRGDNLYGDSIAFSSQGETPSISFFKRFSSFQLFLLSTIIFSILGLANYLTRQQSFSGVLSLGVGEAQQQFTSLDNILFSSALVPSSENLGAALLIAVALLFLKLAAIRKNMSSNNFRILAIFFIPLLISLGGVIDHLLRYSGSDISILVVAGFWFIGGLITILVGSFIPFWVMHIINNLFIDLKHYFNNDLIPVAIGVVIILFIILYVWLYVFRKKDNNINNIYK